jgi:exosortase
MTTSIVITSDERRSRSWAGWFTLGIFVLIWLELIFRLRFEWSVNPQYGYGWSVPFLAAFIFWRRWQSAPSSAQATMKFLPVATILIGALFLPLIRLVQEANPDWRLMSWAMAILVVAITASAIYLAGGMPWLRHFTFPMLFFLVAVPWPTRLEQVVIQGLMRADTTINVEILNLIGVPAVHLGNVIEVGTGFVGIDEACTGVRSLQATFMVSLLLGELYEFTVSRRVFLVVAGAVVAFLCNLARTFLLVWLGAERGWDSIRKWHDPAGLSILLVSLFTLWGLSLLLRGKHAPLVSPARSNSSRISSVLLICLLISLAVAEAGTGLWYRTRETGSTQRKPWTVVWPSQEENFKMVPEQAQELLRYNEGGGAIWKDSDGRLWGMYFFRWLPGRTAGLFIKNHRPDICLPASGMIQTAPVKQKLFEINGVPLPVRAYTFDNQGKLLHVYYCYWDGSISDIAGFDKEDWTPTGRFRAVRDGKRNVGTQMLEIVAWGYDQDELAERAVRAQLARIIRRG